VLCFSGSCHDEFTKWTKDDEMNIDKQDRMNTDAAINTKSAILNGFDEPILNTTLLSSVTRQGGRSNIDGVWVALTCKHAVYCEQTIRMCLNK